MPLSINSNNISLKVQRVLESSSAQLSLRHERLSSGLRITRAADDAAGLAVSTSLNTDARIFNRGLRNVNDAISMLNVAQSASQDLGSILTRIEELATQAANGTYSSTQRRSLNTEAQALRDEFNRIVSVVEFNDVKLLDGSSSTLRIQGGGNERFLEINLRAPNSYFVGDGTFQTAVSYVATSMDEVEVADLDGDGDTDLVTQHSLGYAQVFLNNGDGTLSTGATFTAWNDVQGFQLADVNNDGKQDIIGADLGGGGAIRVLLGNGNGSFLAPINASSEGLAAIEILDLNGDGYKDLVGSTQFSTGLRVRMGNGDGSFKAETSYAGNAYVPLMTGDVNGDGRIDVVAGSEPAKVYLANSDGSFRAPGQYTMSVVGFDGALADVNNDSYLDIVMGDTASPNVRIALGNGDGSFKSIFSVLTGVDANTVLATDFNDDGKTDLIVGSNAVVSFHLGNGDGTFRARTSLTASNVVNDMELTDLNGDGVEDLIATSPAANRLQVYIANSTEIAGLETFNLLTQSSALSALTLAQNTRSEVITHGGKLGTFQARLSIQASNLQQAHQNYIASASRITDVDFAAESAALVHYQILQQVGAAVLAQANNIPAVALSLLRS